MAATPLTEPLFLSRMGEVLMSTLIWRHSRVITVAIPLQGSSSMTCRSSTEPQGGSLHGEDLVDSYAHQLVCAPAGESFRRRIHGADHAQCIGKDHSVGKGAGGALQPLTGARGLLPAHSSSRSHPRRSCARPPLSSCPCGSGCDEFRRCGIGRSGRRWSGRRPGDPYPTP